MNWLRDVNLRTAAIAHQMWAHWMQYMAERNLFEGPMLRSDLAKWERQMNSAFFQLLPAEQKSDYEVAEQYIIPAIRETNGATLDEAIRRVVKNIHGGRTSDYGMGIYDAVEILRAMRNEMANESATQ